MEIRESRIQDAMHAEGLDRMQAINVIRARNVIHQAMRRDPRAFDFRFGREL